MLFVLILVFVLFSKMEHNLKVIITMTNIHVNKGLYTFSFKYGELTTRLCFVNTSLIAVLVIHKDSNEIKIHPISRVRPIVLELYIFENQNFPL